MKEKAKPAPAVAVPSYRGFIQVLVGEEGQEEIFDVHEELITGRSPFFKAALSGNWQESKERLMKLPEDDPRIFKLYLHFLYTGDFALATQEAKNLSHDFEEETRTVARLYILAEKLQDIKTRNATVQEMLEACQKVRSDGIVHNISKAVINTIYMGSTSGSPMRRLLVDIYTHRAHQHWAHIFEPSRVWPQEFLQELVGSLITKRTTPKDRTMSGDASRYFQEEEVGANK